jgi:hypothetical protein
MKIIGIKVGKLLELSYLNFFGTNLKLFLPCFIQTIKTKSLSLNEGIDLFHVHLDNLFFYMQYDEPKHERM